MKTRHKPEVLAPAGDRAALEAAVRAGADAVYFGVPGFNARARATNFDEGALAETLDYLHTHGRRGYVALNTLVFDEELSAARRVIERCADAGVDALIVQDLGIARLARQIAPGVALHGSTQMTCTDASACELARELGATRVILARELSLEEIAKIGASTGVEIEVFVHGALCVAYSGQCLTSEAIGGRSANRGACAQACRLPYELYVDGERRDTGERAFLLSPEDLEASALVPELARAGVTSLKIEGRLKGPEYVAAVTRLYRAAVDAACGDGAGFTERDRETALATFTRGSGPGFLRGVDHQRLVEGRACDHRGLEVARATAVRRDRGRAWIEVELSRDVARGDGVLVEGAWGGAGELGGRVWEIEPAKGKAPARMWLGPDLDRGDAIDALAARLPKRVFRSNDPAAMRDARAWAEAPPPRRPLHLSVTGDVGAPLVVRGRVQGGAEAVAESDVTLDRARNAPLTLETLREKLGRLGDSPFELGELTVDLPDGVILPVSALNRVRRALTDALQAQTATAGAGANAGADAIASANANTPLPAPPPPGLFVMCRNAEQANAAIDAGADGVYLDFLELTGTGATLRALRDRGAKWVGVAPPRIRKPDEEKIDRYLMGLAPDGVLVRGLGALHELGRGAYGRVPRAASGEADGETTTHDAAAPLYVGDFSLNVANALTAREVLSRGLSAFTPSFDLDAAQLTQMTTRELAPFTELVLHHHMPLFHMEHCVFAAMLSTGKNHLDCGRPCERHALALRDRAGFEHAVEADVGCRNTVFHAKPQSAVHLVQPMQHAGVARFRVELVREGASEVARLVETYRAVIDGQKAAAEAWRGLRAEEGWGVVRGSLRVLA